MKTKTYISLDKKDKIITSNFILGIIFFLIAIALCNEISKNYVYVFVPFFGLIGVFLLLRACWFMIKKDSYSTLK